MKSYLALPYPIPPPPPNNDVLDEFMWACMVKRGGDGEAGKYGGSLNSKPSHVLTNIRFGVGLLFFIGVLAELKE